MASPRFSPPTPPCATPGHGVHFTLTTDLLVLRQLRHRFGALAPEQEARIRALSVTALEALGEALLDFQTAVELSAWLQHQP